MFTHLFVCLSIYFFHVRVTHLRELQASVHSIRLEERTRKVHTKDSNISLLRKTGTETEEVEEAEEEKEVEVENEAKEEDEGGERKGGLRSKRSKMKSGREASEEKEKEEGEGGGIERSE